MDIPSHVVTITYAHVATNTALTALIPAFFSGVVPFESTERREKKSKMGMMTNAHVTPSEKLDAPITARERPAVVKRVVWRRGG